MLLIHGSAGVATQFAPEVNLASLLGLECVRGGDLGDGEPVYVRHSPILAPSTKPQPAQPAGLVSVCGHIHAPPLPPHAANLSVSPGTRHRVTNPGPASVGQRLREDLEAEFPAGCQCYNCVRGRQQLQLV